MGVASLSWAFAAAVPAAAAPAASPPPDDPQAIIVTGERVKRSLKDTSSSVGVFRETEIESSGANRVDQILALTPNVQLGNGSQGPAIRGLDTTGALSALPAFLGGNRPRTTIVVDGRPVTYNEFVFGAFPVWDVERIEVFRSPQTTTQGQNSIAGAIFVDTNDPGFAPEYRVRAIAGNFRMRQVSAVASGPIAGDDVAFRLAGDFRYSRTTSRIDDVQRGTDPNHDVYGLLRAKLLAKPGPGTQVTLTYVHSQSQAPQIVGLSAPFRERHDRSVSYGIFRVKVDSLTAAVRQRAGRDLTANVLVTAGESKARRFAISHFGEATNDGRDWSAETILNWAPEGPLRATAGFSHVHLALKQFIDLSRLSGSIGRFRDWQDGTGLFGEAELALSSRASVTAGLRYQRDRQKRVGALVATGFTVPIDFVGNFHSWLPKLSLAYDVTPGVRVGAMVQKAYNPGGTTIRVDTSRPDDFEAESLWDYELFGRAELAGGRGSASANLFYYDMRNAQRSEDIAIFTPTGLRVGFANLFNVPKARSYGAEGQLRWRFDDALSGSVAVGLLGTKVVRSAGDVPAIEGKQFDRSPHFSASAAVDWAPAKRLRLSAQLRHHSPYFTDPRNSPAIRVGSATIADARAEYRIGRYSLFGQVRNLFDTLSLVDLDTPDDGEAEDPRTFGVGVEARF
jgi:outer membrane receptor protein involved in Fe transport